MPKALSNRFAARRAARFDPVKPELPPPEAASSDLFSHLSAGCAKALGLKYCLEVCVAVKVQSGQDAAGQKLRTALKSRGISVHLSPRSREPNEVHLHFLLAVLDPRDSWFSMPGYETVTYNQVVEAVWEADLQATALRKSRVALPLLGLPILPCQLNALIGEHPGISKKLGVLRIQKPLPSPFAIAAAQSVDLAPPPATLAVPDLPQLSGAPISPESSSISPSNTILTLVDAVIPSPSSTTKRVDIRGRHDASPPSPTVGPVLRFFRSTAVKRDEKGRPIRDTSRESSPESENRDHRAAPKRVCAGKGVSKGERGKTVKVNKGKGRAGVRGDRGGRKRREDTASASDKERKVTSEPESESENEPEPTTYIGHRIFFKSPPLGRIDFDLTKETMDRKAAERMAKLGEPGPSATVSMPESGAAHGVCPHCKGTGTVKVRASLTSLDEKAD